MLKKEQEEKYKLFKKEQEELLKKESKLNEPNTVKLEEKTKVPKQNVLDNLKERMKKFTKGFNLFKPEMKAGKIVTFETWVKENKIHKDIVPDFKEFHRKRISKLIDKKQITKDTYTSSFGTALVDSTPEFNDPKEIVKSWIMFNMKKAGKFVKKNSKKIAAVAAVTGAAVAGTQAVKRRRKTSPKRKKRSTSKRRKTSPKRKRKTSPKRRKTSPKRKKRSTSKRRKTSPRRKKRGTSPKRRKTSPRRRKKTTNQAEELLKDVRKILKA